MDNSKTIEELKNVVDELIKRRAELDIADNQIPPFTLELRKQKRTIQALSLDLLARKNALQSVIREREAASSTIPPLDPNQVAEFEDALSKLNTVIKADQGFDAIVAVAKGIIEASGKIEGLTDVA
jgi:hypothetical protein